jgi:hypothetical protein
MVIRPFETRPDDGGLELHDDGEGEMVDVSRPETRPGRMTAAARL